MVGGGARGSGAAAAEVDGDGGGGGQAFECRFYTIRFSISFVSGHCGITDMMLSLEAKVLPSPHVYSDVCEKLLCRLKISSLKLAM